MNSIVSSIKDSAKWNEDTSYDQDECTLYDNLLGYHKEDGVFCLECFPVENAFWFEGRVECFQTMGRLTLLYRLALEEEQFVTSEDITVEASSWRLEVSRSSFEGSDRQVHIEELCGNFAGGVRRRFCSWSLQQEDSGDQVLVFTFSKLEYEPWRRLWWDRDSIKNSGNKGRYIWNSLQKVMDDERHLTTMPHDTSPVLEAAEYHLDPTELCISIDDMEIFDEGAAFYIHFDVNQYLALEAVVPLEQVVRADIKDNHILVYLHVEEDVPIFEAELGHRCVPEQTLLQPVRCRRGLQAYNPALQVLVFADQNDGAHTGGPLFLWHRHAVDIIETQRLAKEISYKTCEDKLRQRSEELCGHAAPPNATEDVAKAERGMPRSEAKPYMVDNSTLKAVTRGLGYRLSKELKDKDGDEYAEWGTLVTGIDHGEGWLKVGHRYLPFSLGGKTVLISQTIDPAPGSD